jgi:hypothetical protein
MLELVQGSTCGGLLCSCHLTRFGELNMIYLVEKILF